MLSIVLRCGTKNKSVKELSTDILNMFKSVSNLKEATINKLTKINGIGEVKAITLIASIELGRRVYQIKEDKKVLLNDSKLVYNLLHDELYDLL